MFYACDDDDNFSTNNSLRLQFSSDTVRFDTVFTTIGSATKRLMVYNRNNNAIRISNVDLVSGGKKGFRINVDGIPGNSVSDVEILAQDSMYVFIEVTVDPLNSDNSLMITDSIRFRFNGISQYVALEAVGQDVILWKAKKITKDTTITSTRPYLIYDSLVVTKEVRLNIEEGVMMYFHGGSKLQIDGTINALGTIDQPIIMRGDRTDNLFEIPKVPYDRVHGQWDGIHVAGDSYNNRFENVRIRNAVYGILFKNSTPDQVKATIQNTMIQNTTREGILSINSKLIVANSLIANSGKSSVRIIGGDYTFIQNTIVNYMSAYWGFLREPALVVSNTGIDNNQNNVSYPLISSLFANTIIAGSSTSELRLFKTDTSTFNYQFVNCLIRNNGSDDEHFINIVWGVDPLFRYIYTVESANENTDNYYYYDFELTEDSPARNKGSKAYVSQYPFDIRGVSRLGSNPPDIGCYQYVSKNKALN